MLPLSRAVAPLLALSFAATANRLPARANPCLSGNYSVLVTPHGGSVNWQQNTSGHTSTFTVHNTSLDCADTYVITYTASGPISGVTLSRTNFTLLPLDSTNVVATYSVGALGTGLLTVKATGTNAGSGVSDVGDYTVTASGPPTVNLTLPALTSGSRALVHNRQPLVQATLLTNLSALDTTRTAMTWRGEDVTTLARANRGLLEWHVDSTRWLGVGDSAQIQVTACAGNGLCTTVTRWAVLLNDQKPVIGLTGVPLEALDRAFSAPFGPGLTIRGADVETGFGTPPYFSLGAPRSAGLEYSTRQAYPRSLVPVDVELPWPSGTPAKLHVTLFDGATRLDSVVVTSPTCATGALHRCRAVVQADFSSSSYATPIRKWLTVQVQVDSGSTTQVSVDSTEVVLVDRRSTMYGSGWWPSAVLKLVPAGSDRILVGPGGTASIFRGNGDSLYLAPPGEFAILQKTGSVGWTLKGWSSTAQLVFDTNGRLVKGLDQNSNKDSIAYSGASDQVTALIDPVGKSITFSYDGNGKLATLTDPGGRQTAVRISGTTNQLTYDSLSSPATRGYSTTYVYAAFPGTNTAVLTQRTGVIGDATTVTYDSTFRRRPTLVALPQVQDENGHAVNPILGYTAFERQGFGALVSLDSVYVAIADARGNWTRSLLNRWGEARKTWDAIGVLSQTAYTPEGFVQWTEGKVPDSSRLYHAYDVLRRPLRTYIVRAVGDTMLLDSLVYDANHRLIQRFDSRRKMTQYYYDSRGNLIQVISPNGDVTKYYPRPDGLLDSLQLPNVSAQTFAYDPTWKTRVRVADESREVVDTVMLDSFGRPVTEAHKLRVQSSNGTASWQWQRQDTWYNAANQVDSTLPRRSTNCGDPCNAFPSLWQGDSTRALFVGHAYDRAGRDSLRIDARGRAVLLVHDRLGRVMSRRPWTDSMAVRDSFVYDVEGNLKKTITRRADTIATNYDSRNRDTLTTIPGVGTLRKQYSGPLDQVTRLWYDSPVDSIGTVNGEVRWAYDQRGRLKADTSYAGTTVRATSYSYDAYERLTAYIDPLGTWMTRYETNRGYRDTLLTPMGDTLSYTFDVQSRAVGPIIHGGGPLQLATPIWNAPGALQTLTDSVATSPGFVPLRYARYGYTADAQPALIPQWTEQEGLGAAANTWQDTVVYDGWGRVTRWVTLKNNVLVDSESFSFDRAGNIRTKNAETYDSTTNRLLSRVDGACGTWNYAYDRAGNLVTATCGSTTWAYGYDALNKLRSARQNNVLIARYAYDVLGRRVAKRVYSGATGGAVAYTRFVYHHADAVAFETDSAGSIGLRYTWGEATDELVAVHDVAGNHYYAVRDQLQSVRGLVRRDGSWMMSQRFGPYGAVVTRDTSASISLGFQLRYAWAGREFDRETGWYYFRARYFDPSVRRYVEEDPIGYRGGYNVYAYASGGPLQGRDTRGTDEDACEETDDCYDDGGGGGGGGGAGDWFSFADSWLSSNGYESLADVFAEMDRTGASAASFTAGGNEVLYFGDSYQGNNCPCTTYTYSDGTRETRSGGSRTWRDNNPGALQYGGFAINHGAIANQDGMAVFRDYTAGWLAEVALINSYGRQGLSLDAMIGSWCGGAAAGCNVSGYQAYVRGVTGYVGSASVGTLDVRLLGVTIQSYEGWVPGTSTWYVP